MVKFRAFIRKYAGSDPRVSEHCKGEKEPGSSLGEYSRMWRSVCKKWILESLDEKEGEVTPVYVLYNAYLKDNPQHYLDIAQFGKILKSRFPNRKCRRGKQGAQIYVYKNVIIKPKAANTVSQEAKKGYKPKAKASDDSPDIDDWLLNGSQSIADDPLGQLGVTSESSSSKILPPVDFLLL
ncbi:uncharacterized protein LOC125040650 [Penaeus chinensis]|uniref:uncharacterized protein LOC125040650 n=1 Tax=Penaeus chinensis TaxID=139456 RepID=UPI001FB75486|nr:uncharacterized protein LOC125040650 [Penaeus chinensis]